MAKEQSTFAARRSVEVVVRAQSDERLQMGGREPEPRPRRTAESAAAELTAPSQPGVDLLAAFPAVGELRELTEYLARTCFHEDAVPQATADLVDVAATAAPGCRWPGGRERLELARPVSGCLVSRSAV